MKNELCVYQKIDCPSSAPTDEIVLNPERVNTLNNDCLKAIVTEYAPYFQKTALTLDGPNYLTYFNLNLTYRVYKKPELNAVLYGK